MKVPEDSWATLFETASRIQNSAVSQFLKICGTLLGTYLVLRAFGQGTLVSVTVFEVTAAVPKAYYAAVGSIAFNFAIISLNHTVAAVSVRASLFGKIVLPGFSTSVYGLIRDHDDVALGLPLFFSNFFQERLPVSSILTFMILFSYACLAIPLFAFGFHLGAIQYDLLVNHAINSYEKIAVFAGLLVLLFAYLNLVLFNLPLPYKKNTNSIRWGFLSRLPPPYDESQIERWLEDKH